MQYKNIISKNGKKGLTHTAHTVPKKYACSLLNIFLDFGISSNEIFSFSTFIHLLSLSVWIYFNYVVICILNWTRTVRNFPLFRPNFSRTNYMFHSPVHRIMRGLSAVDSLGVDIFHASLLRVKKDISLALVLWGNFYCYILMYVWIFW